MVKELTFVLLSKTNETDNCIDQRFVVDMRKVSNGIIVKHVEVIDREEPIVHRSKRYSKAKANDMYKEYIAKGFERVCDDTFMPEEGGYMDGGIIPYDFV